MIKMLNKFIALATLVIVPTIFAQSVQAGMIYDFSYDFDATQNISGQLYGDLQGDLDTLHVTDVWATIIATSGNFRANTDAGYFVGRGPDSTHDTYALVSLTDGFIEFILHAEPHSYTCRDDVDTVCIGTRFGERVGGVNTGAYNPDDWSIAVPEPSIIALFGLGLLGLGFARRREAQS
jgi:hypothetical protein